MPVTAPVAQAAVTSETAWVWLREKDSLESLQLPAVTQALSPSAAIVSRLEVHSEGRIRVLMPWARMLGQSAANADWVPSESYMPRTTNADAGAGVDTVGVETVGVETVAVVTVAVETVGVVTVGVDTVGADTVGVVTVGVETVVTVGVETVVAVAVETVGVVTVAVVTVGVVTVAVVTAAVVAVGSAGEPPPPPPLGVVVGVVTTVVVGGAGTGEKGTVMTDAGATLRPRPFARSATKSRSAFKLAKTLTEAP